MKKIIFILSIILLSSTANVIAAPTNEEIVISAAKATIEKARADSASIVFNSVNDLSISEDSNYDFDQAGNLSSMRSMAELYYSINNTYGTTSSSCHSGLFKNDLMTDIIKKSKAVNCSIKSSAKKPSWAVSIKSSDNKYYCVDSTGFLKNVGMLLPKGVTACSSAKKAPVVISKYNFNNQFILFPKAEKAYDVLYTKKIVSPKTTMSSRVFSRDNTTYELINDTFLNAISLKDKTYLNKYLIIPHDKSELSEYESFASEKIDKTINLLLTPGLFTAKLIRNQNDGSIVYEINVSNRKLALSLQYLLPKLIRSSPNAYFYDRDADVKINLTIKDGVITSVYSQGSVVSQVAKNTYSVSGNLSRNYIPVAVPSLSNSVSCAELFKLFKMGEEMEKEVCSSFDESNISTEDKAVLSKKGIDATTQARLSNMRALAELYYSYNNNYGPSTISCDNGMFSASGKYNIKSNTDSIKVNSNDVVCHASASYGKSTNESDSWVMSAKLQTGPWYCVDSTGVATTRTSQLRDSDIRCK